MTNRKKEETVTKNFAIRAFDYAVCQTACKTGADKATICIKRKGGCPVRANFIKKLEQ